MSEVTDAMAAVGETEAGFGTKIHDYVLRAKDAAKDRYFEAHRQKLGPVVMSRRLDALAQAEKNRAEYAQMIQERFS